MIVYTTVPSIAPAFIKLSAIVLPHPDAQLAAPVTLPDEGAAVQIKLEDTDEPNVKLVVSPLQCVSSAETVAAGFGFTVTFTVNDAPAHKVEAGPLGVTVYLTVPVAVELELVSV